MPKLRRVTEDDCRMLFEWANDAETRANSAVTGEIGWDEHVRWFDQRLADPATDMWIGIGDDGEPAGVVRFQVEGDAAEISVNVAPERRGGGTGTALIEAGCDAFFAARDAVPVVVAYIRPENSASLRAFAKARFVEAGEREVRGVRMKRLERAAPG